MMSKLVLVTGANGFVASHLLPRLVADGWNVRAAVRDRARLDQTGSPPTELPSTKLAQTLLQGMETVIVGDIDGATDWQTALERVDVVIHLAARAHILNDDAATAEAEFHKVNVLGTANLVRQSMQVGVNQFVFMSSIGAIATLSETCLTEASPCRPDTPYGRSKLQAELLLQDLVNNSRDGQDLNLELEQSRKMTWTILRPTLVYGAGNPGNMARLINLVKTGLPLPLGAIANRRSFVYVENLVDAIAACLEHPQAINQTFIVSDGRDLSTPQLVALIAQNLHLPCRQIPVPIPLFKLSGYLADTIARFAKLPNGYGSDTINRLMGSLFVDHSHISNSLGWQPPISVEQGLAKMLRSPEK